MKKSPVDVLVTEWAYRCKKGYPDINNEEDKKVLEKIMKEWKLEEQEEVEEITVDDLIKLLRDRQGELPADFIKNIYTRVKTKGKGLSKQLQEIFKGKDIDEAAPAILNITQQLGLEGELLTYLTSDRKVTVSDLVGNSGANLVTYLTKATSLPEQFVSEIVELRGQKKTKGVGKVEYALALFAEDGKKATVGDVIIQGKTFEIKSDFGRLGLHERGTGNLKTLYSDLENLTQVISEKSLEVYIKEIINQVTDENVLKEVRMALSREFDNEFDNVDLSDTQAVRKALYSWYVEQFLKAEESDYILIYLLGEYRVYTPESFKKAVLNEKIKFKSNFTPTNKFPQLGNFS